jgi:hypothetical protein
MMEQRVGGNARSTTQLQDCQRPLALSGIPIANKLADPPTHVRRWWTNALKKMVFLGKRAIKKMLCLMLRGHGSMAGW